MNAHIRNTICALCLLVPTAAQAGPGAHGPDGQHLDAPATGNVSGIARLPDGSVNLPKVAQRRLGIRTLIAPESEVAASIELPGRVIMDPNAGGQVQAVYGGRIEPGPKGLPVAGQVVKRGETLAWLRHRTDPFAVAAQAAQAAELRAAADIAEQRVKRLTQLEGTVPRKDIDAARAEAASLRERAARVSDSLIAREALTAPVDGVIARADVVAGQVVEARDVLFEVVDPRRLMIEASTADAALGTQVADAAVVGLPGVTLQFQGAARSLRDGALPLTFRATVKGGETLALGQPVTVIVRKKTRIKGIALPAEAVVRNPSNEPVVWIKVGAERYLPQPVRHQALDARTVVVTAGLAPDNRVVVSGAPLIAQIR